MLLNDIEKDIRLEYIPDTNPRRKKISPRAYLLAFYLAYLLAFYLAVEVQRCSLSSEGPRLRSSGVK